MTSVRHTAAALLLALAIVAAFSYGARPTSANSQSDAITGWAWSDTIGWISMSGTGYGLAIDADGKLSGYAWSDNIGWVSANDTDLVGCPKTPCMAKLQSNSLNGWLKALSADGNGWDGWISLSGSSPNYGVTKNADGTFTGYAWGSDVVGWVDFSYARTAHQVCAPSTAYTCEGSATIASTTVTAYCATSVTRTTCAAPAFCSAGSSTCLYPPPGFNSGASGLTGHLQAVPTLLPRNAATKLYWNVSNVSSCAVTGSNGDHWSGASSGGAGAASSPIVQQTVFTLSCAGLDASTIHETATVNIVPVFQER